MCQSSRFIFFKHIFSSLIVVMMSSSVKSIHFLMKKKYHIYDRSICKNSCHLSAWCVVSGGFVEYKKWFHIKIFFFLLYNWFFLFCFYNFFLSDGGNKTHKMVKTLTIMCVDIRCYYTGTRDLFFFEVVRFDFFFKISFFPRSEY